MTDYFVFVGLGLQGAVLLLLFLLLAGNHVYGFLRSRRRRRGTEELARALRAWKEGETDDASLGVAVDGLHVHTVTTALEGEIVPLSDAELRRMVRIVRDSRWSGRVLSRAHSPFWWRRQGAAELLRFVGTGADADALAGLLADRHPAVSTVALLAARELRLPALVEPLLDRVQTSGRVRHRDFVLDVLRAYGSEIVSPLGRRLRTSGAEGRPVLIRLAGSLGDPSLEEPVLSLTRGTGLETRIAAVRALPSFGGSEVVAALRRALVDPAWQVRVQAVTGLGKLGVEEAVGELRRALSDPSWWVRLRAALALRALGEPGITELRAVGREDDSYAHDMARYVLELSDETVAEHAA